MVSSADDTWKGNTGQHVLQAKIPLAWAQSPNEPQDGRKWWTEPQAAVRINEVLQILPAEGNIEHVTAFICFANGHIKCKFQKRRGPLKVKECYNLFPPHIMLWFWEPAIILNVMQNEEQGPNQREENNDGRMTHTTGKLRHLSAAALDA